jgi:glutaredoxin 3
VAGAALTACQRSRNRQLFPGVYVPVPRIRLYTTEWCGYCVRAKALLDARDLAYDEVSLDDDPGFRQRVYDLGRQWTVPLVTIDGEPIGGYHELAVLDRSGLLAERLAA